MHLPYVGFLHLTLCRVATVAICSDLSTEDVHLGSASDIWEAINIDVTTTRITSDLTASASNSARRTLYAWLARRAAQLRQLQLEDIPYAVSAYDDDTSAAQV